MVIARGLGVDATLALAERAWDAGVALVEVPIQTAADVAALTALAERAAERGLAVGAGTVVEADQVALARDAGATFTVSPGCDDDVVTASLDAGLPTLPGVATATDVHRARRHGLRWLKAFPASVLGPEWPRALHGPFPDARFVATGGITAENALAFLEGGARAVAVGSGLAGERALGALAALGGAEVR
ncbi:bifunctional 4-hydroxy-2-oxoglutarate aldolase/2-dehydro-3-deoxy-phosphogluconate aldolase [Microbacterium immunditiarum]|uniref:Entner-Doudoroff aldolase n=1 Tax=Microbacterium immunditiarum TaxID=337480 RepID=A0A7Y9GP77_9MICO|nr:Entner-Doudoroff aldolase [Microbacterium immunditiarum]